MISNPSLESVSSIASPSRKGLVFWGDGRSFVTEGEWHQCRLFLILQCVLCLHICSMRHGIRTAENQEKMNSRDVFTFSSFFQQSAGVEGEISWPLAHQRMCIFRSVLRSTAADHLRARENTKRLVVFTTVFVAKAWGPLSPYYKRVYGKLNIVHLAIVVYPQELPYDWGPWS